MAGGPARRCVGSGGTRATLHGKRGGRELARLAGVVPRGGVFVCALLCAAVARAGDVFDAKLYSAVDTAPCFRLMTASDGSVGCSSPQDGVGGLLYHVSTPGELVTFAALHTSHARALLLPAELLDEDGMALLQGTEHLAGVVVLSNGVPPTGGFSPAPTVGRGARSAHAWNAAGRSLLDVSTGFPMVLVNGSTSETLITLAARNMDLGVDSFPQHALQFDFYMGPPSLTSITCIEQQQCLPVGGQSVWGTLGELRAPDDPGAKDVVMLAASMDATALFHDRALGGQAGASSIAAMLAAVQALSSEGARTRELPRRVAFGLFQGEAWGRIGSRRWLKEVQHFTCGSYQDAADSATGKKYCRGPLRTDLSFRKLSFERFAHVLAFDQVGAPVELGGSVYLHQDVGVAATSTMAEVVRAAAGTSLPVSVGVGGLGVPPSPVDTLLNMNDTVSAGVLSPYDSTYGNRYFASYADDAANVDVDAVTAFATLLARSAYALATGLPANEAAAAVDAVSADLEADRDIVAQTVHCLLLDSTCEFFQQVIGVSQSDLEDITHGGPLSLYTGVYLQPYNTGNGFKLEPSVSELFVRNYLGGITAANATQLRQCTSTAGCKKHDQKTECMLGRCVDSTVHFHDALTMGLEATRYANQYSVDSDALSQPDADPLFTEPYWATSVGVKLYVASDPSGEWVMFAAGVLVTIGGVLATTRFERIARARFKVQ